jgi:hypothetical protein
MGDRRGHRDRDRYEERDRGGSDRDRGYEARPNASAGGSGAGGYTRPFNPDFKEKFTYIERTTLAEFQKMKQELEQKKLKDAISDEILDSVVTKIIPSAASDLRSEFTKELATMMKELAITQKRVSKLEGQVGLLKAKSKWMVVESKHASDEEDGTEETQVSTDDSLQTKDRIKDLQLPDSIEKWILAKSPKELTEERITVRLRSLKLDTLRAMYQASEGKPPDGSWTKATVAAVVVSAILKRLNSPA